MVFKDRAEAGVKLGRELQKLGIQEPLIFAIPRGGVPVAFEVARLMHIPFHVIVAKKIGSPKNTEYGIGAIAEMDTKVLDSLAVKELRIKKKDVEKVTTDAGLELERRVHLYRSVDPFPPIQNRNVILVDDGLATGVTAKAAISTLKKLKPGRIVLAIPVCAEEIAGEIGEEITVVCLSKPEKFRSVGNWYKDFHQVTDEEVIELLKSNPRA